MDRTLTQHARLIYSISYVANRSKKPNLLGLWSLGK